jgi:hypothetical protein
MSPRKAPTTTAAAPSNPSSAPVQAPGSSADGATTANGHANAHVHADGTSSTEDSSRRHRRGNRLTTEVNTNLIIDSGEGGRRARRRHDGAEDGHGKEEAVVESEEDRLMRIMEARAVAREVGEAIHDAVMKETNKEWVDGHLRAGAVAVTTAECLWFYRRGYIISAPFVKLPNKVSLGGLGGRRVFHGGTDRPMVYPFHSVNSQTTTTVSDSGLVPLVPPLTKQHPHKSSNTLSHSTRSSPVSQRLLPAAPPSKRPSSKRKRTRGTTTSPKSSMILTSSSTTPSDVSCAPIARRDVVCFDLQVDFS